MVSATAVGFSKTKVQVKLSPDHCKDRYGSDFTVDHEFSSTLWLFNIAMGNGPFIDGLPIKNDDFPWLC